MTDPTPVLHKHGMQEPHTHTAEEYAAHAQPIDNEVVFPLVKDEGAATSPHVTDAEMVDDESDGSFPGYSALTGFQQWTHDTLMQLVAENQALHGEVLATRKDLDALQRYIVELEEKAAKMASPESMQKAMQDMMGNMGFS